MLFSYSSRWNLKPLFVLLLFVVSVGTAQAQPAEEGAIKKSVQTMFATLTRGDMKSAQALWIEKAEKYPFFERMIGSFHSLGTDLQFADVQFTRWNIKGDSANALVHFTRKWRDKKTGQLKSEELIWNVRFEKQNGKWKWSWWRDAYNHVLFLIIDLKTPEEIAIVLKQEKELVNPRLVKFINDMSEDIARQGDVDEALLYNKAATEVCKVLGDKKAQASTLLNRAGFYLHQANYEVALETYERALPLFRELGDKAGEAGVLSNIGVIYQDTARYPEAFKQFDESLKIARELGDKALEAGTLGNVGNVHQARGEYPEAMAQYEASLKLKREIGDEDGIMTTQNNIANILAFTGRHHEALAIYQKNLLVVNKSGDKREQALIWGNMGNVYDSMGLFSDALAFHKVALMKRREIGNKSWQADTLNNIGLIYHSTGQYEDSLERYNQSWSLAREIGDKALEAKIYNNAAMLLTDTNQPVKALKFYEDSLKITREIGDKPMEALTLNNITNVLVGQGKFDEALKNYEASKVIMRAIGNREGEAATLINIGFVYYSTGRFTEALTQSNAALTIAEEIGDVDAALRAYWLMGLVRAAQKQWDKAANNYRQAVQRVEILRANIVGQSLQSGLFERFTTPYFGLTDCLLNLQETSAAWQISEQAKARVLVDILQNGQVDVQKSMTSEQKEEEQKLNADLTALGVQLSIAQSDNDKKQIGELKEQVETKRLAYDNFRHSMFVAHPDLQTKRAEFTPATLEQLNQTLFAEEPDLCVLSYLVGENETLLFVLTRGETEKAPATLTVHRLPLTGQYLTTQVSAFRLQCATADGQKRGFLFKVPPVVPLDYRNEARALYQALLEPAKAQLKGKKHVVILPDNVLHTLPFQALLDEENRHFIEKFALSYAPSATALLKDARIISKTAF